MKSKFALSILAIIFSATALVGCGDKEVKAEAQATETQATEDEPAQGARVEETGKTADEVPADYQGFVKSCDNNDADSCRTLGNIYKFGSDTLKADKEKAKSYYQKACDINKDYCAALKYL